MAEAILATEAIIEKVQSLYADARVEVAGEGCNLELLVISDGFQSMPVMKRQQSLLKLFADDLTSGRLHAISIKAKSPAEMNAANTHLVQLEGM